MIKNYEIISNSLSQLGLQLFALRTEKKLSMESLSKLTGLTIAAISRIESGKCDPHYSTITRIMAALISRDETYKVGKTLEIIHKN
jgi:transcriptional regulator with XRE-family HTH domain